MNQSPPEQYTTCQNATCKNADFCLRQLAYRQLTKDDKIIKILNPLLFPKDNEECSEFRTSKKIKLAWGIKKIFDDIPSKKAKIIKKNLINHFGKTLYYRFYRNERAINSENQNFIKKIFEENGIETEINYESYTENYDWQ